MTNLHVTVGPSLTSRRTSKIDITEGATVRIQTWDGRTKTAKVEGLDSKDGRSVLDLDDDTWCYTSQVAGGSTAKAGSVEVAEYDDDDDDDWN